MVIIISLIAGVLITWIFSHIYYTKSSKEIPDWANKIPEWAKPFIERLPPHQLSSEELLKLFQESLNEGSITQDPIFRIVACPNCNAPLKDLDENMYGDENVTTVSKTCPQCGWSENREV